MKLPSSTVPRTRCVILCAGASASALATGRLLVQELTRPVETVDGALVEASLLALLGCVAWAWLGAVSAVHEAWRGQASRSPVRLPDGMRRLLLVACGVAVAGALAQPASAVPDLGRDPLDGLPLPERAMGPAQTSTHLMPPLAVTVEAGDCLWSLASRELGLGASAVDIEARWRWIYRLNKAVIGPDPQLIHPGQILRLPSER
jgi:nucleoid-associated protein YgaU